MHYRRAICEVINNTKKGGRIFTLIFPSPGFCTVPNGDFLSDDDDDNEDDDNDDKDNHNKKAQQP